LEEEEEESDEGAPPERWNPLPLPLSPWATEVAAEEAPAVGLSVEEPASAAGRQRVQQRRRRAQQRRPRNPRGKQGFSNLM
jgi:hypothetical protein